MDSLNPRERERIQVAGFEAYAGVAKRLDERWPILDETTNAANRVTWSTSAAIKKECLTKIFTRFLSLGQC